MAMESTASAALGVNFAIPEHVVAFVLKLLRLFGPGHHAVATLAASFAVMVDEAHLVCF